MIAHFGDRRYSLEIRVPIKSPGQSLVGAASDRTPSFSVCTFAVELGPHHGTAVRYPCSARKQWVSFGTSWLFWWCEPTPHTPMAAAAATTATYLLRRRRLLNHIVGARSNVSESDAARRLRSCGP